MPRCSIYRGLSLVHCYCCRMKQILALRCVYRTICVINNKKRRFLADKDLRAHSSQRVPPCSAALPQQFELRIV